MSPWRTWEASGRGYGCAKSQRVTLHSWALAQLGQFLEYTARRAGVPLVYVDPAYTSQECAAITSRQEQGRRGPIHLPVVRIVAPADLNAAASPTRRCCVDCGA
ncbi:zinc ribbon domain-containing protein [Streptomyces sp. MS2.AVA.5]|uniref:Zinc ribbon domain-containing protein n=2 Tax=Streptomyces achmelvichensis TaxID=3134111 RepID=A0ACC6Q8H0_9ACTN